MPVDAILESGQAYGGRAYVDCRAAALELRVPVVTARSGMRWRPTTGSCSTFSPRRSRCSPTPETTSTRTAWWRCFAIVACAESSGCCSWGMPAKRARQNSSRMAPICTRTFSRSGTTGRNTRQPEHSCGRLADARFDLGWTPNTFGHPASTTLASPKATEAAIYRTDRCGAPAARTRFCPAAPIVAAGCKVTLRASGQAGSHVHSRLSAAVAVYVRFVDIVGSF